MTKPEPLIAVDVDPTNPGQFFACCGLLELADRLWPGAEGCFSSDGTTFQITCGGTLQELMSAIGGAHLIHDDTRDPYSSSITVGDPFRPLRIDWWLTDQTGAKDLKVWAGTMESYGIARAMQVVLSRPELQSSGLFNVGMIVTTPDNPSKKKEPYYFDARRAANAHSRDIGFSPNDLGITTTAFPAVEFLCLAGLQRARPDSSRFSRQNRVYDYSLWTTPIPTSLLAAVTAGRLRLGERVTYRFENWFRTGQKKHKAFRPAVRITEGE